MINIIQTASAYTLLQPLPGIGGGTGGTGLTDYLNWLFRFMLVAAAFLAVVQIIIGGIQMMIGGASETQRTSAKSRIQDAIYGLLLALASWLILWTINPNLASMNLTIPEVTIQGTAPTPGGTTPGGTTCGGNKPGTCPSGQTCELVSGAALTPTATYACQTTAQRVAQTTCGGNKFGTCPSGQFCDQSCPSNGCTPQNVTFHCAYR
jgi:hypothetical protein